MPTAHLSVFDRGLVWLGISQTLHENQNAKQFAGLVKYSRRIESRDSLAGCFYGRLH